MKYKKLYKADYGSIVKVKKNDRIEPCIDLSGIEVYTNSWIRYIMFKIVNMINQPEEKE